MSDLGHNHSENFFSSWHLMPEAVLPVLLAALAYWRISRARANALPRASHLTFYLGLLSVVAVTITPIGANATQLFWCHMIQHMVLMMVTGPLLVLGTVDLIRPPSQWRSQRLAAIWEYATNPWFTWFAYAALIIGVHFTQLHEILMGQIWVHRLVEIPAYLIVAYLFYFNILDRNNPKRRISPAIAIFMLFFMMVPETLTGFFIYASPHSLYQDMFTLNDQRLGGALMWSGSMIIDAIWLAIAVSDWLKDDERRSREIDEEIARGN